MTTLTIELPDEVAQQIQGRGISQQQLEKAVVHFVQELLREGNEDLETGKAASAPAESTWSDGAAFARRVIAGNRELFEELARL